MAQDLDLTGTLDSLTAMGDGYRATVAPNWSQGRAGFGGVVAALGLAAIRKSVDGGWPLRSLGVAFVGPSLGEVEIQVRPLRRGRSAAYLQAMVLSGGEVGATVTACLGPDRESAIAQAPPSGPEVPAPEACPEIPLVEGITPTFLRNLEIRLVRGIPFTGERRAELLWWVRHRDPAGRGTEAGLVALLDTLPPAASALLRRPAPLSSLTWMVDFATTDFATTDGWYLLSSVADHAAGGFSGQAMTAWTRCGRLVALHRQTVAIFG